MLQLERSKHSLCSLCSRPSSSRSNAVAPVGLGPMTVPVAGLFWTPYADWIYTVVLPGGLLLITWLVLGRSNDS